MPTRPVTEEEARQAIELYERYGSWDEVGKMIGKSRAAAANRARAGVERFGMSPPINTKEQVVARQSSGGTISGNDMSGTLHIKGRVTTEAEAVAKSEIDLDVWEIEKMAWSFYETTIKHNDGTAETIPMTAVKFRAKRRSPLSVERIHPRFIKRMKKAAPRYPRIRRPKKRSGVLLEIAIPDLHIGKYAWAEQTGEAYNIRIAERVFREAVSSLLSRAAAMGPIDQILFPVGNDLLHVDNDKNTTARGTPQDTDGQWQRMYLRARMLMVEAVESMRAIAPVHVIGVPGNHGKTKEFCLVDALECWFHKARDVTFDNAPTPRKYYGWGTVLIGLAHGDEEKHDELPKIMARECKDAYANATHIEWHLGHFHIKRAKPGPIYDTHGDALIRIIKSLSGADAWHAGKGYGSPKGAEAFLFTRTGLDSVLNFTPDQSMYTEESA